MHDLDIPDIVGYIMGYKSVPQTWQMKHGINIEPHAKQKFKQLFKKSHKHTQIKDPGMTVCYSYPYISGSPDLEIFAHAMDMEC